MNSKIKIISIIISLILAVSSIQAQNWERSDPQKKELQRKYKLANQLERNGRLKEAGQIYKQLIKIKPGNRRYVLSYINLLSQMGNFPEMIEVLQDYLDLNPGDLNARLNLGIAFYNNNQKKRAFEQWNKALKKFEYSDEVTQKLFMQLVRLQEYKKAEELVAKLRKMNNDKNIMALELGRLFTYQTEYKKALHEFLKYARSTKKYNYITRTVLQFPDEEDVYTQLEIFFKNEIPSDSKNIDLLNLKEKVYFKYKKYDKAIEVAFRIEQINGYKGSHIKNLCNNLVKEKKYELAESTYYRILKDAKFSSIKHQAMLGIAGIAEKKIQEHRTNIFNYFYPDNYFFNSYYYYGIESKIKYLDEAFGIYDTLLTRQQNNRFSAKVNYRLGNLSLVAARNFDSALKFLRRAYQKTPNINFKIKCARRLAQTYLAKGEKEQAHKQIESLYSGLNKKQKEKLYPDLLFVKFYNNKENLDSLTNNILQELGFKHNYYNDIFELYSFLEEHQDAAGYSDFLAGEIKLRQDKLSEAKGIFKYIINNYESSIYEPALFRKIQLELYFENYDSAEALVTELDSTSIYKSDALFMLAEVAHKQKQDTVMAQKWYREMIVNYPDDINMEKARQTLRKLKTKK